MAAVSASSLAFQLPLSVSHQVKMRTSGLKLFSVGLTKSEFPALRTSRLQVCCAELFIQLGRKYKTDLFCIDDRQATPETVDMLFLYPDEFSGEPSCLVDTVETGEQPIDPISDICISEINDMMFNSVQ